MHQGNHRAVFLDRDGTLIPDLGYPKDPQLVRLLPGAGAALAALQGQGVRLVLVSNQSGIGRGLITREGAARVHDRVASLLAADGVRLDGAYYCPHAPGEGCSCRKPAPGLLLRAARELDLDPVRSFLVGDQPRDVDAGRRAGCRTVLLLGERTPAACQPPPDVVAADWPAALAWIVDRLREPMSWAQP